MSVYYLLKKTFFVYIHFLINKIPVEVLHEFFVEQLAISENLLYMHNNYIIVAWLRRCKGVEISSQTFTMIL